MKLKWFKTLFVIAGLLFLLQVPKVSPVSYAQEGLPPAPKGQPLDQVEVLKLPPVDVQKLLQEDARREGPGVPARFAQAVPVSVSPDTHGTWETLEGDLLLWRLRIISSGALSLNLGFARYKMPAGGTLLVYTADYNQVIGPFTGADNESHGQLWTPLVPGDDIVIELTLPAAARPELQLELASVNHGYEDINKAEKSGSCNVDVACSQGNSWREEIRSVARYTIAGIYLCTGALINNTRQDGTPYFLTANHCSDNWPTEAASMVFYWNYENSTCRAPGSSQSGQPGNGSLSQFQSGAILRANYIATDVTLVELDDEPNPAFNVYWAGWDRIGGNASSAVAIHHPSGDEKRISFENQPTTVTSYFGTTVPGNNTHVRVADWDLGTTEQGSSGSPLFDQNHRIIGQLHGGEADCGNDLSDWYGRFSMSWAGGGTAQNRLSTWLDPTGTGAAVLNGSADPTGTTPSTSSYTYLPLIAKPTVASSIVNGDFESGNTGWVEYSLQGWVLILNSSEMWVTPHAGSWAAWLAGDHYEISYIQQQVTVPAAAPYLSYWRWIYSEDLCGYDFGGVIVNGVVVEGYDLCDATSTSGWVKHAVNLSAYAGQSVSLQIRAETDGSLISDLFIDDVAFQATAATGLETSAPGYDPGAITPGARQKSGETSGRAEPGSQEFLLRPENWSPSKK